MPLCSQGCCWLTFVACILRKESDDSEDKTEASTPNNLTNLHSENLKEASKTDDVSSSSINLSSLHSEDRPQSRTKTMSEGRWLILPRNYPKDLLARTQQDRKDAQASLSPKCLRSAMKSSTVACSHATIVSHQPCRSVSSSTGSYNTCPTSQHSNNIPE